MWLVGERTEKKKPDKKAAFPLLLSQFQEALRNGLLYFTFAVCTKQQRQNRHLLFCAILGGVGTKAD